MVKVRTAKSKGNQFEMDCCYSLKTIFEDIRRLGTEGFQAEYDIDCEIESIAIECKRLKGISWNQLVKIFEKLKQVTPHRLNRYVLFKSNRQPCLVFYEQTDGYVIETFKSVFGVEFQKHESTRIKRK